MAKAKSKLDLEIERREKSAKELRTALEQLKATRNLAKGWGALKKRGKFISVNYWRSFSFLGIGDDRPVDMAQIWNWIIKVDQPAANAFHASVATALADSIKKQKAALRKLAP